MAAGLSEVNGGGIVVDGREVHAAGPDRAVVFQAPSLFPWLTAAQNVALGVDRVYRHASAAERADIVDYYLTRVGLGNETAKVRTRSLERHAAARRLARAFALNPKLLLLDEPFGMLDSLTRWELQELLMEVWARTQVTAICVTHDVDEAILLADRVVMMTNGPNARVGKIMHDRSAAAAQPQGAARASRLLRVSARGSRFPGGLRAREGRRGRSRLISERGRPRVLSQADSTMGDERS